MVDLTDVGFNAWLMLVSKVASFDLAVVSLCSLLSAVGAVSVYSFD